MANKRMFSLDVVNTDMFLDMPASTQCLYFHLGMRADDDGFVSSPKQIMRAIGSTTDDLRILVSKGFVIPFESGVIVICHWKQNNNIRSDRYRETKYISEKQQLQEICGIYILLDGIPSDNQLVDKMETQIRLDKNRLDKNSIKRGKNFVPPTHEDVENYCKEKGYSIDACQFIDFYESKGWMVGKNKMKDWKAAVRTWVQREKNNNRQQVASRAKPTGFSNFQQRDYDMDELERQLLESQKGE